jgi:SPP1 family phage portal protein
LGILDRFRTSDLPKPQTSVANKSEIHALELILRDWLESPQRKEQLLAEQYYEGDHDILKREKKVIGADGELVVIHNVANNKLVDNQYRKLVDQKTNYALGKPITIATENDEYLKSLNSIFNKQYHRKLRVLAQYSVDGGIAWLYPHYNENREFKIAVYASYEVCPIWKDKEHTELESAMRYYKEVIIGDNGKRDVVYRVEWITTNGVYNFKYQNGSLIPDKENPHRSHMVQDGKEYDWKKLPIIPFKYNHHEIPLIRGVKPLQDALNQVLSDFMNNMEEDPRTSILVLKNYDGTNIQEFRQNLATYGVIKVTTVDGVQGGVETLKVEVNAQNYQAILMQLKRALVENGRGFDAKEERMDGDPNQMNIESMYTDIDLDVNAMETEFQAGFEELKWFIDQHLKNVEKVDYGDEEVEFIFNRDIFINEDAKINSCVQSVGILSRKTLLSRHPWVTNVAREEKQLEEDQQREFEEMEIMNAFNQDPGNGGNGGD